MNSPCVVAVAWQGPFSQQKTPYPGHFVRYSKPRKLTTWQKITKRQQKIKESQPASSQPARGPANSQPASHLLSLIFQLAPCLCQLSHGNANEEKNQISGWGGSAGPFLTRFVKTGKAINSVHIFFFRIHWYIKTITFQKRNVSINLMFNNSGNVEGPLNHYSWRWDPLKYSN